MTTHSQHKRFSKNRKGYSTLIATIFMVLILLFLMVNVFMFMLDRNTALEDTTSLTGQMDVDRITEQLSVFGLSYSADNASLVSASFTVNNISPLSIEIVSVWIKDLTLPPSQVNYGCNSTASRLPIVLQPGEREYVFPNEINVTIAGAKDTDSFASWFVTRRGRAISTAISMSYVPGVLAGFVFNTIGTQKAGVAFTITIMAVDAFGGIVRSYTGTNTLNDEMVAITPGSTGSFAKGVWTGPVAISQATPRDVIFTQGGGSTGNSNPFNVTGPTVPFGIDGYSSGYCTSSPLILPSFSTSYPNDIIYLSVAQYSNSVVFSISTPPGISSWVPRSSIVTNGHRLETWYANKSSSGPVGDLTITFSPTTPNWAAAVVFGVSGANTASPWDITPASNSGQGVGGSVIIPTAPANDLIMGAIGVFGAMPPTLTAGAPPGTAGFNIIAAQPSSPYTIASCEYLITTQSYSPLPVGYSWNYAGNRDWIIIAEAIRKAP